MPIGAIVGGLGKLGGALGGLFGGGGEGGGSLGSILGSLFGGKTGLSQLLGLGLGAYGNSGAQGSAYEQMLQDFTRKGSTSDKSSGFQQAFEDPTFAQFRSDLMPLMKQEMRKANEPIYGDAQKAALMNQLNDLAGGATAALKSQLARSGATESGLLSQGLSDIQTNRFGQLSSFFSQLPFMENEARANRMNSLLGLATNWVGKAPLSYATTSSSTGTTEESGTSKTDRKLTQEGPSFGKQLAGDVGTIIGEGGFGTNQPRSDSKASTNVATGYKIPRNTFKNPFNIGGNV